MNTDVESFSGKTAVITGGGAGIGRELALRLVEDGCNVAICDVSVKNMAETKTRCVSRAPRGTRVSTFVADVSMEDQVQAFAQAVARDFDHINFLFNNAGIVGCGSFVRGDRAQWEKVFNICWYGVYYCTRALLPLLMKAKTSHIINVSSVHGFWATGGVGCPNTAYSAAKFAIKGFTEALMVDLQTNAPHIRCSVVMPGQIGTDIVANSIAVLSGGKTERYASTVRALLAGLAKYSSISDWSSEQIRALMESRGKAIRDNARTTVAQAATTILDGVRAGKWRILIGPDAEFLDKQVRANPEDAYSAELYEALMKGPGWASGHRPNGDVSGAIRLRRPGA